TADKLRAKINLSNITVVNNGIDFSRFGACLSPAQNKTAKIILSVGQLKQRKGYHISIPAVAVVKAKYPGLRYFIVGQKSSKIYWTQLQNLVQKYSLAKNVIFLSKISEAELLALYQQADVFVLAPVNIKDNFEGFGLVYLEAGACGQPVVGTFDCGAQEAIRDGVTGILVPQNDVKKTAQAILRLLDDSELARRMGQAGREKARTADWEHVIEKYVEIYKKELCK
ncbi:MAG: hypothetical protein COU85_01610, partial [Candidatus Portnoybacteria bacterium CG10_big_fil_rev_8_21_14_0_10_44_7]